jgi:hypothetical protein
MTREIRKAFHQALACGGIVVLAVATVLVISRRPAGADELRLPIAELRSQAAELEQLRAQAAAAHVTPRFARVHAQQLARSIDASRDELAAMQVEPQLVDARASAAALAAQLAAAAHRPDATLPIAPLQALETSLQR